ncbi:MAG: hypothetical protein EBS89_08050, partial [Proteobacteria bacterium]|nr:hypothetical protein [Pseudomonadota bacterium]
MWQDLTRTGQIQQHELQEEQHEGGEGPGEDLLLQAVLGQGCGPKDLMLVLHDIGPAFHLNLVMEE